jgi:hypothetical protein
MHICWRGGVWCMGRCCARTKIIQKLKICPLRPSTYFQRWVKSLYFAFTSVFEQLYYSVLLEIEPWMPPLCRLWCEEDEKLIQSCILINAVNYSLTFRETWIHPKRVLNLNCLRQGRLEAAKIYSRVLSCETCLQADIFWEERHLPELC